VLPAGPAPALEMPFAMRMPFSRASAHSRQAGDEKKEDKSQETREKEKSGSDDSSGDPEHHRIPGETMLLGQPHGPDPLGDENTGEADIEYKTCTWWQTGMLMIAETISLGILSLPSVMSTVGLIPGLLLILGMGAFATYSGYVMFQFKMKYPWVKSMADAFEILFAPWGSKAKNIGKEVGGAAQVIFLIFSMASHILTWTICFNVLTEHAVCNIVWGIVALVVFWIFDLPRTLKKMSYFSVAC